MSDTLHYDVPFANSLWHIDGHHKLIRYKIVIHGGIDGKSHLVTFMKAANNNRASTVFLAFKEGVYHCGLPSRVRADHGGEMVAVKAYMEARRGTGRGSFITGPSTSNQRIERLWVDLQRWSTVRFAEVFGEMEGMGIVDCTNPVHIWCLHRVFMPALNESLQHFQQRWNQHPMATKGLGGLSPMQQWIKSTMTARSQGVSFPETSEPVGDSDACDQDQGPSVFVDDVNVLVPESLYNDDIQQQLLNIGPLAFPLPEDGGIAHYCRVLEAVALYLEPEL
ncbi:unnamed protein product [Tilletia caries]|uniref:Integrase catalytic domain-containing protein n=3 Tax=Tilletia TaxID=13289 RepID=A0ABN7ISD6_9BASI|nr:unnamed protein product [Tilletia caries]